MKKYFPIIMILAFALFISCKQTKEKQQQEATPSFTEIQFPEMENSSLPFLFSDGENLLLSYVTQNDIISVLHYTELKEGQWSQPETIASGTDWFVNWADFPQLAQNGNTLLAHFLKKSGTATYAYDIYFTQKNLPGSKWSEPKKLHSDNTKTEHGFVTLLPYNEDFFVTWLDGRNTSGGHDSHDGHSDGGAMTVRSAIIKKDGSIENEVLLDERVCDCCQTTAAITNNGPVVMYRDRSEEEVRDISIVRKQNGKWTQPQAVHNDNWKIFGCPVNGPNAEALRNSLVVAWFTAVDDIPKVQVVFSKDNGETFGMPVRVDGGNPLGRVGVAMIDEENTLISWVEAEGDNARVQAVKVNSKGDVSSPISITEFSAERISGFPKMKIVNDKVYFAWTAVNGKSTSVKTGYIPIF